VAVRTYVRCLFMTAVFIAALVSACFALSSGFKLWTPDAASEAAQEYKALRWLPRPAQTILTRLIPVVELGTAVLLLVPHTDRWAAATAVCLSVAFVGVVALDDRPSIAHCGCWGVVSPDIPKALFLVRNILLLGAATAAAAAIWTESGPVDDDLVVRVVAVGVALPFALLLLEVPQIGRVLNAQRLSGGEA
jgi:Methylamine utilisation protein MauE